MTCIGGKFDGLGIPMTFPAVISLTDDCKVYYTYKKEQRFGRINYYFSSYDESPQQYWVSLITCQNCHKESYIIKNGGYTLGPSCLKVVK